MLPTPRHTIIDFVETLILLIAYSPSSQWFIICCWFINYELVFLVVSNSLRFAILCKRKHKKTKYNGPAVKHDFSKCVYWNCEPPFKPLPWCFRFHYFLFPVINAALHAKCGCKRHAAVNGSGVLSRAIFAWSRSYLYYLWRHQSTERMNAVHRWVSYVC